MDGHIEKLKMDSSRMKLIEKISDTSTTIYDGSDYNQLLRSVKILKISDQVISTDFNPVKSNELKVLLESLSGSDQEMMIKEEKISNKPPNYLQKFIPKEKFESLTYDFHYEGETLPVLYFHNDELLILFTFGEKQPSRWIFIIRSIWKIKNN